MNKLLIFIFLFFSHQILACEICGCANGFSYFGMMPNSNKSFLGLRFKSNNFTVFPGDPSSEIQQEFLGTELWFQLFPIKNLRILGVLPYHWNTNHEKSETLKLQGLSDPSFLVNYPIFNSYNEEKTGIFGQILSFGLGLKLPLAKFRYDITNDLEVDNPNFQLGSGGFDYLINLNYTLRIKEHGMNLNHTMTLPQTNSEGYEFGNRQSFNLNYFYTIIKDQVSISPILGYSYEFQGKSIDRGIPNDFTGGSVHSLNSGMTINFKKIGVMANYQTPISQNLSDGELFSKPKLIIQLNYLF